MNRLVTIPASVDPHVHLRGMTWSYKGDFASETSAAVAGGYWLVCDMPNTPPATLDLAALQEKRRQMSVQAVCDWGIYYGASAADNTASFPQVIDRVCGLKMFCNETTGSMLIEDQAVREAHFAAWNTDKPIAVHAENETVAEILQLVRQYRRRTHFLHISTAYEIALLTEAKRDGLPVTVGVCPHHLWLTEEDEWTLGAFGRMKPRLKTAADRDALWRAIEVGVVDVVESDHAPHTREEKMSDSPPYGVPGLETTIPLLLTAVHEERLTLERVVRLVSDGPRALWKLAAPPDTYCVAEIGDAGVLDESKLLTQCGWSPFAGMRLFGRVRETVIRGSTVFDGERVSVLPGFGRDVWQIA